MYIFVRKYNEVPKAKYTLIKGPKIVMPLRVKSCSYFTVVLILGLPEVCVMCYLFMYLCIYLFISQKRRREDPLMDKVTV